MATRCYADKENSMVINYNGDIFKCTANDFLPELREGRLNPDGSITFNNQYQMRMNAKYKLGECLNCAILPICQSCSQDRLRMLKGGECRYKNDKLELVKDQIKLIAFE